MTILRSPLSQVQQQRKSVLRAGVLLLLGGILAVAPYWREDSLAEESIELAGFALIALAIVGRTWCTLYIGGRKKSDLVDEGPYSLSRNPLYVFSLLGVLGIGMTTGSVTIGLFAAGLAFAVFDRVVRREEAYLAERHGPLYDDYRRWTPRWLSWRATWRDAERLHVRPGLVLRTFRDACVMLLAVPAFEAIGTLHALGHLPVLLHLP